MRGNILFEFLFRFLLNFSLWFLNLLICVYGMRNEIRYIYLDYVVNVD